MSTESFREILNSQRSDVRNERAYLHTVEEEGGPAIEDGLAGRFARGVGELGIITTAVLNIAGRSTDLIFRSFKKKPKNTSPRNAWLD